MLSITLQIINSQPITLHFDEKERLAAILQILKTSEIESLTLKGIDLKRIPSHLFTLEALHTLCFENCFHLESIPQHLSKLKALRRLIIRHCPDFHRVDPMDALQNLECLEIEACDHIYALPDTISSLKNLRALSLRNCDSLTSLPEALIAMASLELLDIHGCFSLELIPETLSTLSLRSINIREYPLPAKHSVEVHILDNIVNRLIHSIQSYDSPGLDS